MRPMQGRVAEWFKALVLKTSDGATYPWVRIPPLPPGTIPDTSDKHQKARKSGLFGPRSILYGSPLFRCQRDRFGGIMGAPILPGGGIGC